jgi:hypothetical protein
MRKNNINLRVLFIMLLSIVMIKTNAQTGLNFQGVARTTNNVILASQAITIKLSILQGSATGTADYTETRKVMTNAQGLFTAVIGDTGAISTLGNFTTINWKISPKFLKIEMDATAGTNFITMGTTQFQYVAYAQFAKSVDAENIVGIVPVTLGGTGVNSLTGLKTALTLNNVNNTTDLTKPISTLAQTALDLKANASDVTTLLALKANLTSPTFTGTVSGITKTMVGLANVDNTSDVNKPVSTLAQTALDLKAPLASPTFTGTAMAPTATAGTNTTQIATTAFVTGAITTANALVVPYTGATQAVDLGAYNLTVNGVSVGRGSGDISITSNTAIGASALSKNTTGSNNTANGVYALVNNTTGSNNSAQGIYALELNTTGSNNTSNGMYALLSNTTGSYNTAIGNNANVATGALTNATAIGAGAIVNTDNTIQLGNTSVTNVKTSGTITADAVTYPKAHGTAGQVLSTTGSGTLAWTTPSTTATAYSGTLPVDNGGTGLTAAGTNGQVLTSTGSGTLTWTNVSADAGILTGTTLKSTVTGSSLTSVGILSNATVNGKVIVGASSAASSSAVLEASSTTQGFLPPRLNYYQKTQITSPVAGLTIWCINCGVSGEMQVFNGGAWTNMSGGTATGTISLNIGDSYQGGKVAYVLQSGDPGYDANTPHGLIAATSDQSTGIRWYNGYITTGATGTAIGTGLSNTNTIITSQGATSTNYAAGLARAHNGGGYTDWYLPSKDELAKLYAMKLLGFGGFSNSVYWSSSEYDLNNAWGQVFNGGTPVGDGKDATSYVRAVRAFQTDNLSIISIGEAYQGGIVAYILVSGDPGYDPNFQKGLIVATSNQGGRIRWDNGSSITTGATGTAIGTGLSNTNTIITSQGAASTNYAAGLARAYTGGGYTDWNLPSKDELNKLYLNKTAIGGFANNSYWSSTEVDGNLAWNQLFGFGNQYNDGKNATLYVRAIRAF